MEKTFARRLIAVALAASTVGCGSSAETETAFQASDSPAGVSVRGWSNTTPSLNLPESPLMNDLLTLVSRDAEARIGDFTAGAININIPKISKDGKHAFFFANSRELSDEMGTFAFATPPYSAYLYASNLESGKHEIITVHPVGGQGRYFGPQPLYTTEFAASYDGRYLAFDSDIPLDPQFPNVHNGVYRLDRQTGECKLASLGPDGAAYDYDTGTHVSISSDGRYVTFMTFAAEGSDYDLRLRDLQESRSELIATHVSPTSYSGRIVSGDGRVVIYSKAAPTGEEGSRVYRHDRQTGQSTIISTNDWGEPEDYAITDNGRFVIYRSRAVGLSPENLQRHELMVYDHESGQTEQVNFDASGNLIRLRQNWDIGGENPLVYDISEDGRFVIFVGHDPMENTQKRALYFKDRSTGEARRISAPSHILTHSPPYDKRNVYWYYGMYATLTGDGSKILYSDFLDNAGPKDPGSALYLHSLQENSERVLSRLPSGQHMRPEAHSWKPSLSEDGSLIAYSSSANLLDHPDPPHLPYPRTYLLNVRDHTLRETSLTVTGESITFPNTWGIFGAISKVAAAGNRVVVTSDFDSLQFNYGLSIYDVASASVRGLGLASSDRVDISANGEFLALIGQSLAVRNVDSPPNDSVIRRFDIYAEWVRISGDGSRVAFATSSEPNTGDFLGAYAMFWGDIATGSAERLTQGDKSDLGEEFFGTYHPISRTMIGLSSDGQWSAFPSGSTNLITDDTNDLDDLFVQNLDNKTIQRIQGSSEPNGPSYEPSLSKDGRFVAFTSYASNLVSNDTNGLADVFVYDRTTGRIEIVSQARDGSLGDGISSEPYLSDDGQYIAFSSEASNLIPEGTRRGIRQVYRVRNPLSTTVRAQSAAPASWTPIAVRRQTSSSTENPTVKAQLVAPIPNVASGERTYGVYLRDRPRSPRKQ